MTEVDLFISQAHSFNSLPPLLTSESRLSINVLDGNQQIGVWMEKHGLERNVSWTGQNPRARLHQLQVLPKVLAA
jgi:hypothetical protein